MYRKLTVSSISLFSAGVGFVAGAKYGYSSDEKCAHTDVLNPNNTLVNHLVPRVSAKSVVNVPQDHVVNRPSEIMKFGIPSLDGIRTFNDFVLSYDRRTRIPNWVFEHLTAEKCKRVEGVSREESKFIVDEFVHSFFQAANADYSKSGYDRGHLAAAGNHRWSQKAMNQTFTLSNIAPQVGKGFNRHAWNTLEKYVRHLTKVYRNVYVCTGPLFLPRREEDKKLYVKYEVIGKNHIAVPTHFFKVVVCETMDGNLELLSFVMPNKALPEEINIRDYLYPVESIERAAGFLLFDKIPRETFVKINGKKKY